MANRTIEGASSVNGCDPQHLIEKITRERIYESIYWKEQCFGLGIETLLDKAIQLKYVGGCYGNNQPTDFMCLVLKCLQLSPSTNIILEFVTNETFKYLSVLGMTIYRFIATPLEIYRTLEPFLSDYRKIIVRDKSGFRVSHIDEIVDEMLTGDKLFGLCLPRLTQRSVLEKTHGLEKRVSPLEQELYFS